MSDPRLVYQCPKCGKRLHAKTGTANRKARCPACGEIHVVPSAEDPFAVGQEDLPENVAQTPRESSPFDFFQDAPAGAPAAPTPPTGEVEPETAGPGRRCPKCGRRTRVSDPWVEVVCRTCGSVVPADSTGASDHAAAAVSPPPAEAPLPGAASLLSLVGILIYVETAALAVGAILVLVLHVSANAVMIVPAMTGLLVAAFRGAQAQQLARRNSAFRVIASGFDGVLTVGLVVACVLSIRTPSPVPLPTALWVGLLALFVLFSVFRAYVLFYHARVLFDRR